MCILWVSVTIVFLINHYHGRSLWGLDRPCKALLFLKEQIMEAKSKLGPAFKYGEPSTAITIRIPNSVLDQIPEPKREVIAREIIKKYKKIKK
jgi:hypothetical protein